MGILRPAAGSTTANKSSDWPGLVILPWSFISVLGSRTPAVSHFTLIGWSGPVGGRMSRSGWPSPSISFAWTVIEIRWLVAR